MLPSVGHGEAFHQVTVDSKAICEMWWAYLVPWAISVCPHLLLYLWRPACEVIFLMWLYSLVFECGMIFFIQEFFPVLMILAEFFVPCDLLSADISPLVGKKRSCMLKKQTVCLTVMIWDLSVFFSRFINLTLLFFFSYTGNTLVREDEV